MLLQLLIAEPRVEQRTIWEDIFRTISGVTVLSDDARTLMRRKDLDAVLMPSVLAERYGEWPEVGRSHVLSTRGDPGMPPWVVTTAPFAAHLEKHIQPDGSVQFRVVRNEPMSPEEETYVVLTKAFEAIVQFNQSSPTLPIRSLGIAPQILNFGKELRKEAEAVRRAYLEYREKQSRMGCE
jgi:hypothetical protein